MDAIATVVFGAGFAFMASGFLALTAMLVKNIR